MNGTTVTLDGWVLKGDAPGKLHKTSETIRDWDDNDNDKTITSPCYKFHVHAGEEKFVEYVRVDKTSTTGFPYTLSVFGEQPTMIRKYHPLTPLIVSPTSKEFSMFESCLSQFNKCKDGFKKTKYVNVDFKDFKNEKHIDEYYCVLFLILDENIP